MGGMCLWPWGRVKASNVRIRRPKKPDGTAEFGRFSRWLVGIAGKVAPGRAMGRAMTRAGLAYVAMTAAGLSAGVLGYAVIWSYGEADGPPAVLAVPMQETSPVVAGTPS